MKRQLRIALSICTGLLLLASSATASTFDAANSTTKLKIGGLPSISVTAGEGPDGGPGSAFVSNSGQGHSVRLEAEVWSTSGLSAGTSLFTGVPLISNLTLNASNKAGTWDTGYSVTNPVGPGLMCPGGCLGGTLGVNGYVTLTVLQQLTVAVPLSMAGIGGTLMTYVLGEQITVTAGPWVAGSFQMTNLSTNLITLPERGNPPTTIVSGVAFTLDPTSMEFVATRSTHGGFISQPVLQCVGGSDDEQACAVATLTPADCAIGCGFLQQRPCPCAGGLASQLATVTLSGSNALASESQAGQVTLVTPLRIDVSSLGQGILPGQLISTFSFVVPEPGAALLMSSAAVGLALIGRSKSRKRRR